jgi:hypothetical protein
LSKKQNAHSTYSLKLSEQIEKDDKTILGIKKINYFLALAIAILATTPYFTAIRSNYSKGTKRKKNKQTELRNEK